MFLPISFSDMIYQSRFLYRNESAEGDRRGGSLARSSIVGTRPTPIESPTMKLRLSSRQGCLPSSNPYIREGESDGMEHDRERPGRERRKESTERGWEAGLVPGQKRKIELEERAAGGTRCCLLNPRDQYDVPYLFLPRNIADDSVRDTRTCSCFPDIYTYTYVRHEETKWCCVSIYFRDFLPKANQVFFNKRHRNCLRTNCPFLIVFFFVCEVKLTPSMINERNLVINYMIVVCCVHTYVSHASCDILLPWELQQVSQQASFLITM